MQLAEIMPGKWNLDHKHLNKLADWLELIVFFIFLTLATSDSVSIVGKCTVSNYETKDWNILFYEQSSRIVFRMHHGHGGIVRRNDRCSFEFPSPNSWTTAWDAEMGKLN